MSKALDLMKSKQTVSNRAEEIISSVEREVKRKYIDDLQDRIDGLEDRLSEAKQFNLTTNHNRGEVANTREECKGKLLDILELEYQLKLSKRELKIKKAIFADYFNNIPQQLSKPTVYTD